MIQQVFLDHPQIDIVIDDGSHLMKQTIASFRLLYERIHANGVYLVEDTHTCYWGEYGGGLKQSGTFMEFAKERIDDLNAVHTRGALEVSPFTRSTDSISIYDSVVVFEKRPQGSRQALITERL